MDLKELRAVVIENAGSAVTIGQAQLNRIINRAVEHITNRVELTAKQYNVVATPITISVVSGTKEYTIGTLTVVRNFVLVERTDDSVGGPYNVVIIPFRNKNYYRYAWPWGSSGYKNPRPYVYFRRKANGQWILGFPYDPSEAMSIDIYYAPQVGTLALDADAPREVPEQHHELIAVRATIVLLAQLAKDNGFWIQHYVELLRTMEVDLESWNRTGPRIRQVHVTNA